MARPTTVAMSRAHEAFVADLIDGRIQPGSGNQFNGQTDVRNVHTQPFALAADAKSTFAQSISVTRAGWAKLVEQSHNLTPSMPLRFYATERLRVAHDLIVLDAQDFARILWAARAHGE